ncbi:hypothetical protein PC119_g12834 [Phytophthora cactorum]|uniref:Carboxylesterase type B domain-containing protein n=1 Tax=Phytophthora cactorum TaxID=29920 RepID=A0A8T0YYI3_9STRA|nr:hypothetical protein PC111_g11595 [Phytophthora cactorum]KAG2844189.1 hypothetical protein PC112_g2280 [Phytophthora cactorum]KAG2854872.1 hypothetical protein PC113_g12926 [Phytophthora cactorum]KAG2899642.1 hypothetical protein PC114_g13856 [Phytophthora cactorum]KAG2913555.1 hypothetical protein PC115_g11981 [Phytophthora cactorum]
MRSLLFPAAAAALLAAPIVASDAPIVTVKNGSYHDVYQSTYDQDLLLGMPYAQPPVNRLRFQNPVPLNTTWTDSTSTASWARFYDGSAMQAVIAADVRKKLIADAHSAGTLTSDRDLAGVATESRNVLLHPVQGQTLVLQREVGHGSLVHGSARHETKGLKTVVEAHADDRLAGCHSFLYDVPVETLSSIFNSSVASSASYRPIVDGDFLTDVGPALLMEGKFVHVPILHGVNNDEGTAFGAGGGTVNTTEEFVSFLIDTMAETDETVAILTEAYPDIPAVGIPGTLHGRPAADSGYTSALPRTVVMRSCTPLMSEIWAANDLPSYSFNVLTAGNNEYVGATHFTEVAFLFYNLLGDGYNNSVVTDPFLDKPESYKQLARVMTRMWASFIVHENPNQNGATALEWPEYTSDDAQNVVFDANVMELAYVAPDTYRAEGIAYLMSLYNATASS